jgi:hypothetical protein
MGHGFFQTRCDLPTKCEIHLLNNTCGTFTKTFLTLFIVEEYLMNSKN